MRWTPLLVVASTLVLGLLVACGGKVGGDANGKPCDGCQVVPTATQVSCTATASTTTARCTGNPADPWGGPDAKPSATDSSYPVGCRITYPHENPYYPGSPQTCDCQQITPATSATWVCPL
jgi:hypothetical protein